MRESIQQVNMAEEHRSLRLLASTLEEEIAVAAREGAVKTAFASCLRIESAGLQDLVRSSHQPLGSLEFGFESDVPGCALWLMRMCDLLHLGEILGGVELPPGETLEGPAAEACLRFFSGIAEAASRRLREEHSIEMAPAAARLLNPDGKPSGLLARVDAYRRSVCFSFQLLLEPDLDLRIRLVLQGEAADALARSLAAKPAPQAEAPRPKKPEATTGASAKSPAASRPERPGGWNMDLLLDVELPVAISFGETVMPLRDVLKLGVGSIIELDKMVNDPVTVIVNEKPVARGEVVMVEGNYGVRVLEVESTVDRIRSLG